MSKKNPTIQTTKLGNKVQKGKGKKPEKKTEAEEHVLNAGEEPVGHKETIRFFFGLVLLILALFMLLSFTSHLFTGAEDQCLIEQGAMEGFLNYAGAVGAYCANYWINRCFGFSAFILPVFLIIAAMKLTRAYKVRLWKWFLNCSILIIWLSVTCSYFFQQTFEGLSGWNFINPGGDHGLFISNWLNQRIGKVGTFMVLLLTAVAYLAYLSSETIQLVRRILNPVDYIKSKLPAKAADGETEPAEDSADPETADDTADCIKEEEEYPVQTTINFDMNAPLKAEKEEYTDEEEETDAPDKQSDSPKATPELDIVETEKEELADASGKGALEPYDPKLDLENYHYPTLELLDKRNDEDAPIDMEEQNKNKDQIIEVLQNFGVGISSIKATVGPTITLYEITPAKGVRISRIKNLEDDIALSLSALGIRIIAPIPGKGTIGIEVPNARPRMVSMESILNSRKFRESDYELPIALGKTITNEVFMVDLAKMPHLLVAGATGQGKSVGLNAIITSLLYKKHPSELKFVMVDPKMVEFSIYSKIERHYLAKLPNAEKPIVTEPADAVATLNSLVIEMEDRYRLLVNANVRNIKEYNAKFIERRLNPQKGHRFLPYIVAVVDEFADLIAVAGREIELPISRIAAKARAVGIHMILATQRPDTKVITGTIKSNFPSRIAFKVASMIDSRTILDAPGANRLIGRGDMLIVVAGQEPVRVQCAFVDTPEVEDIVDYIGEQTGFQTAYLLPDYVPEGGEASTSGAVDLSDRDPLFDEAARLIVIQQQGSTSLIQRKFAIGYNRAGRLMDQLEAAGIVGPFEGSKARQVLVQDEYSLEQVLNALK